MESTFPGVQVYLACREDSAYLLKGEDRIITKEELKENKHLFGYIRELSCDMQSHPIEEFMNESAIPCGPIRAKQLPWEGGCTLLTNGVAPVRSLSGNQIKFVIEHIKKCCGGTEPELNASPDAGHGWVVGVENESFYQAAVEGRRVTLIPTGFGENLFKKMFPGGQILTLPA